MNNRRDAALFGLPRTRTGWWSVGLGGAFFLLFALWLAYVDAVAVARPTFFSDPLQAGLILAAAAVAVAGAAAGVAAVAFFRERSILVVSSGLLGAVVAFFAVAEWAGH